jgi:hypothetical protein
VLSGQRVTLVLGDGLRDLAPRDRADNRLWRIGVQPRERGIMFDTSGLPRTSEKKTMPWRENRIAFLLVHRDGRLEQSHLLAAKRRLADACGDGDVLLAVRMLRFHPEVLRVDDLDAPREALAG